MPKHVAQSERLWLQELTSEDHLEAYHALKSDERVSKWSSRPAPKDIEDTRDLLIERTASDEKPYFENYAIMSRPCGTEPATFVGVIGIIRLSDDEAAADVGYGIVPDHWGKGYAPEALKLFVDHYWTSERWLQKEKLSAGTEPSNVASQRVLEKAGFTKRGLIEKAFEAPNPLTGEMEWRPVIDWEVERPKAVI